MSLKENLCWDFLYTTPRRAATRQIERRQGTMTHALHCLETPGRYL